MTIKTPIPVELVKELDNIYPEKCPELDTPDREIWHYSGMRQVVKYLRYCVAEQEKQRRNNICV